MDLYEAMSTLRAVRRLRPDPIDEAVIERVLTAATWAPTGGNTQPWRIIAVTDAELKQALQDLYKPHWDAYVPGYEARLGQMPEDVKSSSIKALDAGNYLAAHMHEAPLIARPMMTTAAHVWRLRQRSALRSAASSAAASRAPPIR